MSETLEKTRDEIISDLIQSYDDELQTFSDDDELEDEYEKRFGEKVKVVEK